MGEWKKTGNYEYSYIGNHLWRMFLDKSTDRYFIGKTLLQGDPENVIQDPKGGPKKIYYVKQGKALVEELDKGHTELLHTDLNIGPQPERILKSEQLNLPYFRQLKRSCIKCGELTPEQTNATLYQCLNHNCKVKTFTKKSSANSNHQCGECNQFGKSIHQELCPLCERRVIDEREVVVSKATGKEYSTLERYENEEVTSHD